MFSSIAQSQAILTSFTDRNGTYGTLEAARPHLGHPGTSWQLCWQLRFSHPSLL